MSNERAFCAFCHNIKDKDKGVFLVLWPNGKAVCNNCGPKLKESMDKLKSDNEVA